MKLRKDFVLKALAQEVPFRELCRQFGISRKTGYKWLERFHERGFDGLVDQSTRPERSPGRTTVEIAVEIIRLRRAHPTWGPKKIRKLLSKQLPLESDVPSLRTISRVFGRVHMLHTKKRRRPANQGSSLQAARKHVVVQAPNDLMRARIGGFPDHCQIFTLGPHGRFWLDGQHHVFVSTSMAGLQVGVEQVSDELVHIWLYHLLIGELRIGAGVGRNVSVQPLAPPQPTTAMGDKPGDTVGAVSAGGHRGRGRRPPFPSARAAPRRLPA